MNRAVFLDRDGVLIENRPGYVLSREDATLIPGSVEAIGELASTGFLAVIATNQSAIGRGLVTRGTVDEINAWLRDMVRQHGGQIARWYICPHVPDDRCRCRKPAPGMLEDAAADLDIALGSSYLIGDALSDVLAARAAGVQPILVMTGRGEETADSGDPSLDGCPVLPDLAAAVAHILAEDRTATR